ncbi:hypothetical protein A9Q99_22560 [Gammaproteobacteria bacterium 45_16_T64]|nr:hypothetical protein A9Q99_22560 [Gammaproteobacteria bacterium 45_16_T64]
MSEQAQEQESFDSFAEFYPFYLSEHQDITCRRLHFVGSLSVLAVLSYSIITGKLALLFALPLIGYGFAWIGHFVFEKNRPATFKYPVYSFLGDWVMFKDILLRKVRI